MTRSGRIQNSLRCCGYHNPLRTYSNPDLSWIDDVGLDDATYSKKCYPRTTCKSKWSRYEKQALHDFATAAFTNIPFHLLNIVIALICSNHVNRYVLSLPTVNVLKRLILHQDFWERLDTTALPPQGGRRPCECPSRVGDCT
jgi:hypothetical protein